MQVSSQAGGLSATAAPSHRWRVHCQWCLTVCLCLLAGCDSANPQLAFREVNHWASPPKGRSVPAPRALTNGPGENEILLLDTAGRVVVLNLHGKLIRAWQMPDYAIGNPEGILVLKDRRIAVADTHYHRVVLFDFDGQVLGMFGRKGTGPGEFIYPVALTQDPTGNLYVCEYGSNDRIQKFTADGKYITSGGAFGIGPGEFQRPSGILWRDGELLVVDAINNRVQVFSDDCRFLRTLISPEQGGNLHYPYQISQGADGDLYFIEYGACRLSRYSASGELRGRFGASGGGDGQFTTPWGLVVLPDFRVIVADTGNRRMVELVP